MLFHHLVPLHRTHHRGQASAQGYLWARNVHAMPVQLTEFGQLLLHYPIVFAEDGVPWVLFSLTAGQNPFVDAEGEWRAECYIPAYARAYPWTWARIQERDVLAVETTALLPSGTPWLDAMGNFTLEGRAKLKLLDAWREARASTLLFAENLVMQKMLVPCQVMQLDPDHSAKMRGNLGFYRIKTDPRANLSPTLQMVWLQSWYWEAIFAHQFSLDPLKFLLLKIFF